MWLPDPAPPSSALRRLARRTIRPGLDRLAGPLDVPRRFRPIFRDVHRGDVAIDCGAHVGRVTAVLAERGATVHAFEPNPDAFAVLAARFRDTPHVHCRQQAVALADGRSRLHLHVDAASDPVGRATASSLLTVKRNVSADAFVEVETIDLRPFLDDLGEVALLKLDVEGMELPLLEALVPGGRLERIRHVLVEMHDRRSTGGYTPDGTRIRAMLADPRFDHVRLDWD